MALLRVMHAADMPDPGTLVKRLEGLAAQALPVAGGRDQPSSAAPAPESAGTATWTELVERVDQSGQLRVAQIMRDWVRVVDLGPARLFYALAPGYSGDPSAELRDALLRATGERWEVTRGEGAGQPSLREAAAAERDAERAGILASPLVQAAFAAFPQAELIDENIAARHPGERNWSKRA